MWTAIPSRSAMEEPGLLVDDLRAWTRELLES